MDISSSSLKRSSDSASYESSSESTGKKLTGDFQGHSIDIVDEQKEPSGLTKKALRMHSQRLQGEVGFFKEELSKCEDNDGGSLWRSVSSVNNSDEEIVSIGEIKTDTNSSSSMSLSADLIEKSHQVQARTTFNTSHVLELREQVRITQQEIEELIKILGKESEGNSSPTTEEMRSALDPDFKILHRELHHLHLKEAALTQYLQSDPFNEKNVLRQRFILARATQDQASLILNDIKKELRVLQNKISSASSGASKEALKKEYELLCEAYHKFHERSSSWVTYELRKCEKTSAEKRSRSPEFYKKNQTLENPVAQYTPDFFADKLKRICEETKIPQRITNTVSKEGISRSVEKMMNDVLDWPIIERDMTVSLRGETKRFHHTSIPLTQSNTAVGKEVLALGVHGIIPGTRDDGRSPINARMTTLVEVLDEQNEDGTYKTHLMHERLQHGINDHYKIKDKAFRQAANENSARQLIQLGIEADADFVRAQLHKKESDTTPANVFFINTNLTTPTRTPRGEVNDERVFSIRQGESLRACSGPGKRFLVQNPEADDTCSIDVNVEVIDLRFPVNYALDTSGGFDFGMVASIPGIKESGWQKLHQHNERELQKLVGELNTSAPIAGLMENTYQKLIDISLDNTKSEEERNNAIKLKRDIEDQCAIVRVLFSDKSYQSSTDGDRFKMVRHLDLLVNHFREATRLVGDLDTRVINAGGCKSGKDREGIANAEAEAAVMIKELEGNVSPWLRLSDEERAIYDTAVTLVVDNTLQVTGYGGSKNAHEVADRIKDPHALEYAKGLSSKAKT